MSRRITMRTYELRYHDAAHQLRARMWESAHPDAVTRVANLIGSDREMAAYMLAGHKGTVDSLCQQLEANLLKLMGKISEPEHFAKPGHRKLARTLRDRMKA